MRGRGAISRDCKGMEVFRDLGSHGEFGGGACVGVGGWVTGAERPEGRCPFRRRIWAWTFWFQARESVWEYHLEHRIGVRRVMFLTGPSGTGGQSFTFTFPFQQLDQSSTGKWVCGIQVETLPIPGSCHCHLPHILTEAPEGLSPRMPDPTGQSVVLGVQF